VVSGRIEHGAGPAGAGPAPFVRFGSDYSAAARALR